MDIKSLRTPCFLIDRKIVQANCQRVLDKAKQLNVKLRPHVKTHKTIEGALLQNGGQKGPIAVSTMAEARFFADHGFDDILYAFPVTPDKFDEISKLNKIIKFSVLSDSISVLEQLNEFLDKSDTLIGVLLKVDAGAGRAGFHYTKTGEISEAAIRVNQLKNLKLKGVLSHAHHSYQAKNRDESWYYINQENRNLESVIQNLDKRDTSISVISTGSTPTTLNQSEAGVTTEIRPGNYSLFDRFQADIGSCSREDIAGSVLARIAGHYPYRNQMLIDAGALAFSKDQGATHARNKITYGEAKDYPDLQVMHISQEHGLVGSDQPIPFDQFPIGTQLKFIPNHSCLTAACFDTYFIEDDGSIVDEWKPAKGW